MKKTFRIISIFLVLFTLVSCSYNAQNTNLSLQIPSSICNKIFNSRNAGDDDTGNNDFYKIKTQLFVNGKSKETITKTYDGNKDVLVSFAKIDVGSKVYAQIDFVYENKGKEIIYASVTSDTIKVVNGENKITATIKLKKVDGTIEIEKENFKDIEVSAWYFEALPSFDPENITGGTTLTSDSIIKKGNTIVFVAPKAPENHRYSYNWYVDDGITEPYTNESVVYENILVLNTNSWSAGVYDMRLLVTDTNTLDQTVEYYSYETHIKVAAQ